MKIRITKKGLPKAQMYNSQITGKATQDQNGLVWGSYPGVVTEQEMQASFGSCGPGMVYSEMLQKCITQQEAEAEKGAMGALGNFMKKSKLGLPTNPFKTTGNEGSFSNPMNTSVMETPEGRKMRYNNQYYTQNQANQVGGDMMKNLKPFGSRKELKGFVGDYNDAFGTEYKVPFMTPDRMKLAKKVGDIGDLSLLGAAGVDYIAQQQKAKNWQNSFKKNLYDDPAAGEDEGNYTTNNNIFQPNMLPSPNEGMFEDGGSYENSNTMKIRIIAGPKKMAYGGQSGYGLDMGQRNVYTDMPRGTFDSVSNTVSAVPRYQANIEAEGGETIYGDMDGDGVNEQMKISGPRHTSGGVPLDAPEGSFIFSDTKKMKIKDPKILAMFGMSYKKGGITPASIAKRYDVNKFKAVLEDPNADDLSKSTAQLMAKNYQDKLGKLAMVQEGMKGFPQGVPEVAKGVMEATEGLGEMAYGGYLPRFQGSTGSSTVGPNHGNRQVLSDGNTEVYDGYLNKWVPDAEYLSRYNYNGTPKQGAPKQGAATSQMKLGDWTDDYDKLQTLLLDPKNAGLRKELFNRYKSDRGAKDNITEDQYVKNLLEAQRQIYTLQSRYKDTPQVLNEEDWDRNGINRRYNKEAGLAGLTPLSRQDIARFQSAYRDMADLIEDDRFKQDFGQYFQINPQGKPDHVYKGKPISKIDEWAGNTFNRQYFQLRNAQPAPPAPVSYYRCVGRSEDNIPSFETKTFNTAQEAAAAGFVGSQIEASKQCERNPTKTGTNTFTQNEKLPFGYMTPDLVNLAANAAIPPSVTFGYRPKAAFEPGKYVLEDWLNKAQQRQQTYNTAAQTMGTYGPASGLAANMSFLAGQTGDGVSQDISAVESRNVDRANVAMATERQRKDQNNLFNLAQSQELWKDNAIAKQQYDNSRRNYLRDIAKSYETAWNNRMNLGLVNATNPMYNIDNVSGRSYFKKGYDTSKLGMMGSGAGGDWASIGADFMNARSQSGIPDLSFDHYLKLKGYNTTSDNNGDGIPDRRTTRSTMPFGGYVTFPY